MACKQSRLLAVGQLLIGPLRCAAMGGLMGAWLDVTDTRAVPSPVDTLSRRAALFSLSLRRRLRLSELVRRVRPSPDAIETAWLRRVLHGLGRTRSHRA